MAFYQFLTIFPALLVVFTVRARIASIGYGTAAMRDLCMQMFPRSVFALLTTVSRALSGHVTFGFALLAVLAGASWAAHNGTWAMIYGLNRAYEVDERRGWWSLTVTIVGLTAALLATACVALLLMLGAMHLAGADGHGTARARLVEWLVLLPTVAFAFGLLYRFAPNLERHEWRWSTPGTVCALLLWIAGVFAERAYFDHSQSYARSYGPLQGVAVLLLWLYVTNGAILIGGEMNSEIVKALRGKE